MEKKYKSGLVLGKFMPPTLGHFHLISSAIGQSDKLTVLVCSLDYEPIPGELRYEWIKESFPEAAVVHVTDNNPLRISDLNPEFANSTDDFFWDTWIEVIRKNIVDIDVVFTSEQYGFELAQKLNESKYNFHVNHELVDLARSTFPISGTEVRRDPFKNWDFIPDIVKPYYAKKVAIVGPESTGKSTMTKMLAEHYNTTFVAEYGREYTEGKDMSFDTAEFSIEDISNIASGHLLREEQALRKCNKIFFADTETIVTQIWSEIYFNQTPQWIKDLNKMHPQKYNLYLLLDVDVDWVDDGTRHFGAHEQRVKHFNAIRDELIRRRVPFAVINGNYEERFKKAVCGINNYVLKNLDVS